MTIDDHTIERRLDDLGINLEPLREFLRKHPQLIVSGSEEVRIFRQRRASYQLERTLERDIARHSHDTPLQGFGF
jgi:hypothetical protein